MPGLDFIKKYEKKDSEVLNSKNIRHSIPLRYNSFASTIAKKNID